MRLATYIALASALLVSEGIAAVAAKRPALLLLPAEVSIRSSLKPVVTLRWEEDKALVFETFSRAGMTAISGELQVFEESGKEVSLSFPMSLPPMPTGRKEVKKGEVVELALHSMGGPEFPHTGRYYAIANFSGFGSDGSEIPFTTTKRWFIVVDAPAPKA